MLPAPTLSRYDSATDEQLRSLIKEYEHKRSDLLYARRPSYKVRVLIVHFERLIDELYEIIEQREHD